MTVAGWPDAVTTGATQASSAASKRFQEKWIPAFRAELRKTTDWALSRFAEKRKHARTAFPGSAILSYSSV